MFRPSMSFSGPIFELVQVLFKIYIVRSGIPCAYTSSYEQVYLYLKFIARQANSVNLYKNCRSKLLKKKVH